MKNHREDLLARLEDPDTSWEETRAILDRLDGLEGDSPFDPQAGWADLMARAAPKKKKRTWRALPLAAVIALVCLATTALAVNLGVHEKMMAFFRAEEDQAALLTEGISHPDPILLRGAFDGVDIEILQVMADQMGVYVLYEVTVPDRIDLTAVGGPEDLDWGSCTLRPSTEVNTAWGYGNDISAVDGTRITGVLSCYAFDAPVVPGPVTMDLETLGYWTEDHTFVPLVEGRWLLRWNLTDLAQGIVLDPDLVVWANGKDTVISDLVLSPISIAVGVQGAKIDPPPISLQFRDGDVMPLTTREAHSYAWHWNYMEEAGRMFYLFPAPIDVSQVTAVIVGSAIPLP